MHSNLSDRFHFFKTQIAKLRSIFYQPRVRSSNAKFFTEIPDFCLDALLRSFLFYVILYYYYVEFSLSQQNPAGAKGRTMLAIERKNEILQKLRADQRVLVSELAAHYQVTEETIRRDLDKLEKEGYATKSTAAPSSATAPRPTSPTPSAARPTSNSRTRLRTLSARW